ncbi:MAG: hypothetical protein ACI82A_002449 [Candidatus Azotimanducaceae bacterium]|jgi:hypothetical protein
MKEKDKSKTNNAADESRYAWHCGRSSQDSAITTTLQIRIENLAPGLGLSRLAKLHAWPSTRLSFRQYLYRRCLPSG